MTSNYFDRQLAAYQTTHNSSASDYALLGVESEYLLLDQDLKPVEQLIRDDIIHSGSSFCRELGAAQIETTTRPFDIKREGHWGLLEDILRLEKELIYQATRRNCYVFRGGIYPGLLDNIALTNDRPHYLDLYNSIEQSVKECSQKAVNGIPLRHKSTRYLALSQASQLNIQVGQGQEMLDVLNTSYYLSPLFMALSVNAPIIDGMITGCMDVRNILWQIGYDSRTLKEYYENKQCGIGLPVQFYSSSDKYWEDVKTQIIYCNNEDTALSTAQRLFRKAIRLKYCKSEASHEVYLLMENRYISMQQSAYSDIALHLACYTMLMLLKEKEFSYCRFPFSYLQENFRNACLMGDKCDLFFLDDNQNLIKGSASSLIDKMIMDIDYYWKSISRETGDFIVEHLIKMLSQKKRLHCFTDRQNPLDEDTIKRFINKQILHQCE